jgi:hypothetical protein
MAKHTHDIGALRSTTLAALVLGLVISVLAAVSSAQQAPKAESENVRLVGYHDLQGRESLQVMAVTDTNGDWVYVGHSDNYWGEPQHLNPITGKKEWNGTSILNVSDPSHPKLVWHIPNEEKANSRSVSVVYNYELDGSGKDYLARSSQGEDFYKFQIFDITTRDTDPSEIMLVSEITGTPKDSCGPGCGGEYITRAHKGWWSQKSGLYYVAAREPGFRSALMQIWDLKDPAHPKFVSRAWLPGQKDGEPGYEKQYVHHPIVDEENHRVYAGFRQGSGHAAAFDISDIEHPKVAWAVDTSPPGRGPHTVSPIVYDTVPNFGPGALPRTYAFVTDEASATPDSKPCPNPVRAKAYMFDITYESNPFPISTWQVPVGNFCEVGGRFGPHQHAETQNGDINRFEDKIAWVAYFNAGVRVVDLSDPYNLKQVGYYLPETNENSHPLFEGQPTAIQINDVDLDRRGLAYVSDRVGTGLFILEYTGGQSATQ